MRSMIVLSLLLCATLSTGCSAIGEIPVRVSVDCAVLGKEHKLASAAKVWLVSQPTEPPPELKTFLDGIVAHNDKVREICKGQAPAAPATGVPSS